MPGFHPVGQRAASLQREAHMYIGDHVPDKRRIDEDTDRSDTDP